MRFCFPLALACRNRTGKPARLTKAGVEISKHLGPVSVNGEFGYRVMHAGPNGWLVGVVAGHEKTIGHKKPKILEFDVEFYASGDVTGQVLLEGRGLAIECVPSLPPKARMDMA